MTKVQIDPGICGLKTTVTITSCDGQNAKLHIESDCSHVQGMQEDLAEVDAIMECFAKLGASKVYTSAANHCRHLACPVASAILKGIEVECGLALPKDVHFSISREQS